MNSDPSEISSRSDSGEGGGRFLSFSPPTISCPTHGSKLLISTLGRLQESLNKLLWAGWKHNASTPICLAFLLGNVC